MSCLDVLEINPLSVAPFAHLFSLSEDFLFSLLSQGEAAGQHRKRSWVLCDDWEGGGREGGMGGGGCMHAKGWFTSLYSRNQDDFVKQLYRI